MESVRGICRYLCGNCRYLRYPRRKRFSTTRVRLDSHPDLRVTRRGETGETGETGEDTSGSDADASSAGSGGAAGKDPAGAGAYSYLLRLPLDYLTEERMASLERQLGSKREEVRELEATTELTLWKRELELLRPALEAHVRACEQLEPAVPEGAGTGSAMPKRKASSTSSRRKKK